MAPGDMPVKLTAAIWSTLLAPSHKQQTKQADVDAAYVLQQRGLLLAFIVSLWHDSVHAA